MPNILTAPLPGWNVRGYSYAELTPTGERHPGLDLNVGAGDEDLGLPVVAFLDGTVSARLEWDGHSYGLGNVLLLEHTIARRAQDTLTLWSAYAHLDSFDDAAIPGAPIAGGQPIATCGKSGLQRHAHLHFELRYHGPPRMPAAFWGGRLNPAAQNLLYADPFTALRLLDGVDLSHSSDALLAQLASAQASLAALTADRDFNFSLKHTMEHFLRSTPLYTRAGRRFVRLENPADRLITEVTR